MNLHWVFLPVFSFASVSDKLEYENKVWSSLSWRLIRAEYSALGRQKASMGRGTFVLELKWGCTQELEVWITLLQELLSVRTLCQFWSNALGNQISFEDISCWDPKHPAQKIQIFVGITPMNVKITCQDMATVGDLQYLSHRLLSALGCFGYNFKAALGSVFIRKVQFQCIE